MAFLSITLAVRTAAMLKGFMTEPGINISKHAISNKLRITASTCIWIELRHCRQCQNLSCFGVHKNSADRLFCMFLKPFNECFFNEIL